MNTSTIRRFFTLFFVALTLVATSALAQSDVLQSARQAIAAKEPARAVALLQPLEAERAGDPAFDFLLGLALLDSGDAQRAIFAFERVLAVQPNNAQARAEIARAYLMTGERKLALQEFDTARSMKIPDEAQQTIDRYLSAFGAGPSRLGGFLEASAGYDSNVNSATSASSIFINLFNLTFNLDPQARRHGAPFIGLAGGINFNKPINENTAIVGDASIYNNTITDSSPFDTRSINANLGLRWKEGQNALSIGLMGQVFSVDHNRNRNTVGITGQWQHYLDGRRQITVYGQYLDFDYPGQGVRDARRTIVGAAYGEQFQGPYSPSLFIAAYGGSEHEQRSGFPHFGHQPWGIRAGGQLNLNSNLQLFANAAFERRRYGGPDPFFLSTRRDTQFDLRVGLKYEPYRYWSIVPSLSYTDNDSNISLYDYRRTMLSVSVRRDF